MALVFAARRRRSEACDLPEKVVSYLTKLSCEREGNWHGEHAGTRETAFISACLEDAPRSRILAKQRMKEKNWL